MLTRRTMLAVSTAGLLAGTLQASAQEWPQRPIRIVVPFGPGGGADIIGRIVAQSLQEKLGQPVVIENRPGAGGTLGNEAVARADKDGYTLGVMTAGQIIAAVMNKSLRYDTLTAFDPVSLVATAGLIIVARPDFPASDVKELIVWLKANKPRPVEASFQMSRVPQALCRPATIRLCSERAGRHQTAWSGDVRIAGCGVRPPYVQRQAAGAGRD